MHIILHYKIYTGVCIIHLNDKYIIVNINILTQKLEMKLL